jgi:phage gp29-like protein
MVSAQINQNNPDDLTANRRPIEFLTENGYAIVRSWEIDRVPVPINGTYSFVVKREQGPEREIVVTIAAELFANILRQTRAKITTRPATNSPSIIWILRM